MAGIKDDATHLYNDGRNDARPAESPGAILTSSRNTKGGNAEQRITRSAFHLFSASSRRGRSASHVNAAVYAYSPIVSAASIHTGGTHDMQSEREPEVVCFETAAPTPRRVARK